MTPTEALTNLRNLTDAAIKAGLFANAQSVQGILQSLEVIRIHLQAKE
jgi:hypothetical protein